MLVSEREGRAASDNARRGRRLWSDDEKRRIVSETFEPGASVSGVARRHGLNANLLFTWRRQYLRELAGVPAVNLLPVKIDGSESIVPAATPEPVPAGQSARNPVSPGCIEIEAFGACIRLKGAIDADALRSVLDVLSRR